MTQSESQNFIFTLAELKNLLQMCSMYNFDVTGDSGDQFAPTTPTYRVLENWVPFYTKTPDSLDDLDTAYDLLHPIETRRLKSIQLDNDKEQRELHPFAFFLRKKTELPSTINKSKHEFIRDHVTTELIPENFTVKSLAPIPAPMTSIYFVEAKITAHGPTLTIKQETILGAELNFSHISESVSLTYRATRGHEVNLSFYKDGKFPLVDDTFSADIKGSDLSSTVLSAHTTSDAALKAVNEWLSEAKIRVHLHDAIPYLSLANVSLPTKTFDELEESKFSTDDDDRLFVERCNAANNAELKALIGRNPLTSNDVV